MRGFTLFLVLALSTYVNAFRLLRKDHIHSPHIDRRGGPALGSVSEEQHDLVPRAGLPRPAFFQPDSASQRRVQDALNNITAAIQNGTGSIPVSAQSLDQTSTFQPMNPHSIPIAVRTPYLNTWAPSGSLLSVTPPNDVGNGGYLASADPGFWTSSYASGATGLFRMTWSGLLRIDGKIYQFMGNSCGTTESGCENALQISMNFTASRTIYAFRAGDVAFTCTFLTPITSFDLVRQSIPMSYLHVELDRSTVGDHEVQLLTLIDDRWATGHSLNFKDYPVNSTWNDDESNASMYEVFRLYPQQFVEFRERAEYGTTVYAARKQANLSSRSDNADVILGAFEKDGSLDGSHTNCEGGGCTFAYAVDLTNVADGDDAIFAIGHFRDPLLQYVKAPSNPNTERFAQYRYGTWRLNFTSFSAAADFFISDFPTALAAAIVFDEMLVNDSIAAVGGGDVGDRYAAITQLSIRQALATVESTVSYNDSTKTFNADDSLLFMKEISSSGLTNAVDVMYPSCVLFTYLNPELLRQMLEPIFEYNENGLYPHKYASHDLGLYPNATGEGYDAPMPVEESGNMILMSLHYAQMAKDTAAGLSFLSQHYEILVQWAHFLIADSLIPSTQLSTDDFAGTLANQTNLALKGIEGIAAMGTIAQMLGKADDAAMYMQTAIAYIGAWQAFAISSDGSHAKLAYQNDRSWGILYNLFADRLLNLKLVPKSVYDMQDSWYPSVAHEWGVPLDTRHNWTKTDWEMFASATSAAPQTRDLFINLLYNFASNGRVDVPFADLHETVSGDVTKPPFDPQVRFFARPVVGGHFAHLALAAADAKKGISQPSYGPATANLTAALEDALRIHGLAQMKQWDKILTNKVSSALRLRYGDWSLHLVLLLSLIFPSCLNYVGQLHR